MVLDEPMNGPAFRAWVESFLLPTLAPGDPVSMDNLPAHKLIGIRKMMEAAGAPLLYLPPYSPDFNPIERVFSKLKSLLRQATARTVHTLWTTLAKSLDSFSEHVCQNYFKADGYLVVPEKGV